jgi:hypothetical protein
VPKPLLLLVGLLLVCGAFVLLVPARHLPSFPSGSPTATGVAHGLPPSAMASFADGMRSRAESLRPSELALARYSKVVEDGSRLRDDCNRVIVGAYSLRSQAAVSTLEDAEVAKAIASAVDDFIEGGMACLRREGITAQAQLLAGRGGLHLAQELLAERYGVAPVGELDMNRNDPEDNRRSERLVDSIHGVVQLEKSPPPPLEIEPPPTGKPSPAGDAAPAQRPEPLVKWTHGEPRSRPSASTLPASSRAARSGSVSAEEVASWLAPRREGLRWSLEQLGRVNEVLRQPNSDVPAACSAAQRVSDHLSGPIGLRFSPAPEGMEALEWIKKGTAICAPDSTVGAIIKFAEARAALGKLLAR